MLTSISLLSSSLIVHVQGCSAPQIFSKQQMLPFELSSCCSCHVFSEPLLCLVLTLETSEMSTIFVFTTKTTQACPQVFSVNGALTCKEAALLMSQVDQSQNSSKFGHQQLVKVSYVCAFSQSESGKYFERIIMHVIFMPLMIDIKQTNKQKVIIFLFVEKQILHFTIILHIFLTLPSNLYFLQQAILSNMNFQVILNTICG